MWIAPVRIDASKSFSAWANEVNTPVSLRHGILARSLIAVIGVALLVGLVSIYVVGKLALVRTNEQAQVRLGELLDTVERTASIASFVADEQLAKEVVQGLLRNSEVRRVTLRSQGLELAHGETKQTPQEGNRRAQSLAVIRTLHSPFNPDQTIGEIELDADWAMIEARSAENARLAIWVFAILLALVVAAAATTMLFLVIRPIKATSDRLHRLDAPSGERLAVPEGHERSEIGRLVHDINQLIGHLVGTLEQERALRQQREIDQRMYRDLFDNASSGIFIAARDGRLDSYNRAFVNLVWLDEHVNELGRLGLHDASGLLALIASSLAHHVGAEGDYLLTGRRGDERWLRFALVPLGDGTVQGTVTDVTQIKREEASARRMAITDTLTGCLNRAGIQHELAHLDGDTPSFALAMIDLNGFKRINDAMGYLVGDRLLLEATARLRTIMTSNDRLARIGGDEFVLVFHEADDCERVVRHGEHLATCLAHAYDIHLGDSTCQLSLGASVGIALFPRDGAEIQTLLQHAELALNAARSAETTACRLFDPAMQAAAEFRRRIEDDLRAAVTAHDMHLVYQPIVDLRRGEMVGVEALLRWVSPERGFISPDVFIPLAEDIGLIAEIGLWVLDEACRQAALWRREGLDLYVSVNVSTKQIPDDLTPALVQSALQQHGLPPAALVVEITESVLMTDLSAAQHWIASLRAADIRIYLDDFGTGYSSLSYLKRFPMHTVKIDKSFIRDMQADSSDRALVEAIIHMTGSLGFDVVAEGIEDAQQLDLLRQMGCGYGQGYYFSRPADPAQIPSTALQIASVFAALQDS